MIAGIAYIFVLWVNYPGQWFSDTLLYGLTIISVYPVNAAVFALATGGLFILTIYAGLFAQKSFSSKILAALNVRKAGAIVMILGLYFNVTLLVWILFGGISGETISQSFFVYHNMDLWLLSLPLTGLPLILLKNNFSN